ncbi:hypothetical protein MPSEU_000464200 [Mayamaea pseudoterrestris]|nr:hypothetical protein MPSEU_000464200 [Mayamaea pseudoterrestris]
MTLPAAALRASARALASRGNRLMHRAPSAAARPLLRSFSIAPAAASEKPFTPGVGKGKTATGYVGLAVEPNWYNVMHQEFQALLDKMEASDMPETAQYRIDVTKWCNFCLAQAKAHPNDPEAVEDAVNMGQVEELIDMARDEMVALDTYLKVRMWELVGEPNVDFEPNPMKDPFAADGDEAVKEMIRKGMEDLQKQPRA